MSAKAAHEVGFPTGPHLRPPPIRRALVALSALLLAFVALIVSVAWQTSPAPRGVATLAALSIDRHRAAESLARYVRIDTSTPPGIPRSPAPAYLELLMERYARPLGLDVEVLDDRAILMWWRSRRPAGRPLLFLGHADVVPVSADELRRWTHPPFEGHIGDGFVWGRGTLDNKGSTVCLLEAIASLRAAGLGPRRDIAILVLPDEEIGGRDGAGAFVERHLARLGRPVALVDEGSFAVPDILPGKTIAVVAVGEKHYVTVELSVTGRAGHASTPSRDAAPAVLVRALARLADTQLPSRFHPAMDAFLDRLADHVPFHRRVVLRNRWIFGSFVESSFAQNPAANALLRDTFAITLLRAGIKDNVIPARAEATLNLRLLPGTSLGGVLARLQDMLAESRVHIRIVSDLGDTPVSSFENDTWDRLASILTTAMPGTIVAPSLSPGTTDARYFARAGIPAYRFIPFVLDARERSGIHGIDERVSIANLARAIRVYAHVLRYF